MRIQINTDHNIAGRTLLADHVRGVVHDFLDRFEGEITTVEVYLSDQNSNKANPHDLRCLLEARLRGRRPTAVHHDAATLDQALEGAAEKLERAIGGILGRRRSRHAGAPSFAEVDKPGR